MAIDRIFLAMKICGRCKYKKKNTLNPTLGKYVPNKSSTLLAKNFRCQNFRRSMIVLLHPQGFTEYTDGKIRTILLSC